MTRQSALTVQVLPVSSVFAPVHEPAEQNWPVEQVEHATRFPHAPWEFPRRREVESDKLALGFLRTS